jgi:recombination protein RecR
VVESPAHVEAIEKSQKYDGVYHVLHGVLSPADGIGPDNLKIVELMSRVRKGGIGEIILATNPNMEGETTALYLYRLISPLGIMVSRLAVGLPFGSDVEYADEMTLGKAIEGRGEFASGCGENT